MIAAKPGTTGWFRLTDKARAWLAQYKGTYTAVAGGARR
jgi:hypothetical protein